MSQYKSKFTFGNILLASLLLGTVIVIGLIVLVYMELTRPAQRTAAVQDNTASAVRRVEIMSPDGKPVQKLTADGTQPQTASEAAARSKEADAAAAALNADSSERLNTRALTSGAQVRKPPRPKRREYSANGTNNGNTKYGSRNSGNSSGSRGEAKGEVALEPVNRERPLPPRRERSGSRSESKGETSGERTLQPVKPQRSNKQSEAIDALF